MLYREFQIILGGMESRGWFGFRSTNSVSNNAAATSGCKGLLALMRTFGAITAFIVINVFITFFHLINSLLACETLNSLYRFSFTLNLIWS